MATTEKESKKKKVLDRQDTEEVLRILENTYPDAGCALNFSGVFQLLTAVALSAQTTDKKVNQVTEDLFRICPTASEMAEYDEEKLQRILRPIGMYRSKAKNIISMSRMLMEKYGGQVPEDQKLLEELPGVGRKSANLIMGDVFGKPAIVTDTHCIRLVNRIGLVDGIKEPKKVEMALWKIIPAEEGSDFCHRLVWHGREVCTARTKPHCERCCLADICKKNGVS